MATIAGSSCPELSDWPFCEGMSMDLWGDYTDIIINANPEIRTMTMVPLVTDDQINPFLAYAHDYYESIGHPEFGYRGDYGGIVGSSPSNEFTFLDRAVDYGRHNISAIVLLTGKLNSNSGALLFNTYSGTIRLPAVDDMLSCLVHCDTSDADCDSLTDVFMLIQEAEARPAALIYSPIFPRNMTNPHAVGLAVAVFNWDTVLNSQLSESLSGIVCVIVSTQFVGTYTIMDRNAVYIGDGDLHDSKYDSYVQSDTIFDKKNFSTQYRIHVYPSDHFGIQGSTDFPIYGSAIAVCVIALTSVVVFFFDRTVAKDAREKELVGDTKRLFVRYVSHEIRTPLNTIHLGLVFLHSDISRYLRESDGSLSNVMMRQLRAWIELVDEIEGSADIAVTVLNDLIYYDKIAMGTLKLELTDIGIVETAINTIRPFLVQAKAKNITLSHSLAVLDEFRKVVVVGDEVKISQVIRNLICNALKFTPAGGNVTISAELVKSLKINDDLDIPRSSASGAAKDLSEFDYEGLNYVGVVRIAVKDSGVGLSAENLLSLFQEGVQFNCNQLQGGKGSGLGLWISKGFAVSHGGDLIATSDGVNSGSVFTLELPGYVANDTRAAQYKPQCTTNADLLGSALTAGALTDNNDKFGCADIERGRADIDSLPVVQYSSSNRSTSLPESGKVLDANSAVDSCAVIKNILVVDDSLPSRKMLCRLLQSAGFICSQADNGQIAVDMATSGEKFDLILMDFEMPVMDGPVATKTLKSMGCRTAVVGITGNILPDDVAYFRDAGALDVLHKPLTLASLNDMVAKVAAVGIHA